MPCLFAALCGIYRRRDVAAERHNDSVPMPPMRFASIALRAATGGRRRQKVSAMRSVFARMGISSDFLRVLRRRR